jgi:spermidine synthase
LNRARTAVLAAVFVCAVCGLIYELSLVALGSYLIGDAVGQASIVLGVMVFAMGIGALITKPFQRWAVAAFAVTELLLALLGGLSVLALYAAFAWLDLYGVAIVVAALVLGLLIGAEIPLLMVLLQRIRAQDPGHAVADLFAVDYVGALLGGLGFPFLLLPAFGLLRGAVLVGALNALVAAALILALFRADLGRRGGLAFGAATAAVAIILGYVFVVSDRFEVTARQQLYRDPIVVAERSRYQDIVLTERGPDMRLFLNGDLQFSSVDEYRYHEALVHPVLAKDRKRVLILGGGDALALREVLRYPDVESVTLVELDPAIIQLARHDPRVSALNRRALDDPRVRVVTEDAFAWLRDTPERFDAAVVDMPDPDETATAKLYSVEFYGLVRHALTPSGRMAVQSGSPYFAQQGFWCVEKSISTAGFATVPYHVDVPSFGDWGFVLAAPGSTAPALELAAPAGLRFLNQPTLAAAANFPPDRARVDVPASTLLEPRILSYARKEWVGY